MSGSVSPLAPAAFPDLPAVAGVSLHAVAAGLRYKNRRDLMLAVLEPGSTVAGAFTRSACPSAPVDWCRTIIAAGSARALVCNAGNANAFTGAVGAASVQAEVDALAAHLGVGAQEIFVASTGVIGQPLDDAKLTAALADLAASAPVGWSEAAEAIATTDTFTKGSAAMVSTCNGSVVGIAKGSGMIAPDMATMLGFLFTDVAVTAEALQQALSAATAHTFNRITVDSDTSTSDTVLLFSTGAAANSPIDGPAHPAWAEFSAAVFEVCLDLAHQVVRDGEGATKFIEVRVESATDDRSAEIIARSIANSPLVKTALGAEDANWGRIVMAVGKAGQPADRDKLAIWIGEEQVTEAGLLHPDYSEERANVFLAADEILVRVDLGLGEGSASIWTCDLTHGYVDINASYRS